MAHKSLNENLETKLMRMQRKQKTEIKNYYWYSILFFIQKLLFIKLFNALSRLY